MGGGKAVTFLVFEKPSTKLGSVVYLHMVTGLEVEGRNYGEISDHGGLFANVKECGSQKKF